MVYLINKVTQIAMLVLVLLVVVAGAVFVYYILTKNKRAKRTIDEEDTVKVAFDRKDTREYVKHIEDICDNMIVTDGGKRFVAALICTGYDFAFETAERQLSTVSGMYAFSNTITKPVSYRQYSKPVDLEYTMKRHRKALEERSEELFHVQQDIKDMERNLLRERQGLSADEVALYEREIAAAKKREKALKFRCLHLEDEIRAVARYTGSRVDPETVETWIFEWSYDPFDFSYDMKPEEVHYRAVKELFSIGQAKIHALANCGVRARRATTEDLIEMCRWYSSPVSSERYKLSDIKESSFFDDITASDPLAAARKRAIAEIKEASDIAYYEAAKEARENYRNGATQNAAPSSGANAGAEKKRADGSASRRPADGTADVAASKGAPAAKKTEQVKHSVAAGVRKPVVSASGNSGQNGSPVVATSSGNGQPVGRTVNGRRPIVRAASGGGSQGTAPAKAAVTDLIGED